MKTITVEEVQTHLPEMIRQLAAGGELIITQDQQPVARLVRIGSTERIQRPRPPVTGIPTVGA